jgi:hypothetical protein
MIEELSDKITAKDEAMYLSIAVTLLCDIRRLQPLPDIFSAVCWSFFVLEPETLGPNFSHIL